MSVLHIIEPEATGHRMEYVRRLIAERMPGVTSVMVSTFPSSRAHPSWRAVIAAAPADLVAHDIAGEEDFRARLARAGSMRQNLLFWSLIAEHWRTLRERGTHVVVPYLDYCLNAIALRGSPCPGVPLSGITMRPTFHWPAMGVQAPMPRDRWLRQWLFARAVKQPGIHRVFAIDPTLHRWAQQRGGALAQRVAYVEDPADLRGDGDRVAARQRWGLSDNAEVILSFGNIDFRKGIRALIAHLAATPNQVALIVGKQDDEVRRWFAGDAQVRDLIAAKRIIMHDAFVDRQDEWLAFRAADIAWLRYDGFYGPSGFYAQAKQAGLKLIPPLEGLIAWRIANEPAAVAPEPFARTVLAGALT